ncbi:carboxypeptidase regulatory-like domain-containing protein, partial [Acidobacteriota bacterium]
IFVMCLLCVGTLFASETGQIKGRILDEEGAPLPGVSVLAKSSKLQGDRRSISDVDGIFKFPLLPIGDYSLTFELVGFENVTYSGYKVQLGFTTSLEIVLKIETLSEEIIVTADTPLIDKTNTDNSYRLNAEDLTYIPVQARTIDEIVAFTPGVTGVRANTIFGTGTGLPSFRGAGEEGNNWLVDGLSQRGVRTNDSGVAINYDAWEEIQIISDGFTPDMGQSLGGIINIVTKSGGNELHGEMGALVRDWHLRSEREDQLSVVTVPDTSIHQYFGNIGGSVVKDKLWFFLSNNFHRTAEDSEGGSIGWLTFPKGELRRQTNNLFGKITYSPIVNHTLSISGTLDAFVSQSGGTGLVETYEKDVFTDYSYRVNYRGILSESTLFEAAFGQYNRDFTMKPLEENYRESRYFWQDIGQNTNNAEGDMNLIEQRTDFTARITQYLDTVGFGRHELGLGFNYFENSSDEGRRWTGDDFDFWKGNGFDNGVQINWASRGNPLSLTEYGPYKIQNSTRGIGVYIKDIFTLDRFSIMLGFRSETQDIFDDTGEEIWSWGLGDFISPRASIAIDLLADGKNILKFSFGQFKDIFTTRALQFFNTQTGGFNYRRYNWIGGVDPTDAQLKDKANWDFILEQSADQTPYDVDENLKPNKTTKFLLEFDRELTRYWALKIRGVYSYSKDITELIGVYDPDTIWFFYLTNFELKKRDYKAIELEVNGRISDKFMLNASYTWSEAKGTSPGQFELGFWSGIAGNAYEAGVFGDHVLAPDGHPWKDLLDMIFDGLGGRGVGSEGWYGFLPYSVDHQVKILGTYFAPYGIAVSGMIEYLSGYHWEKKGYSAGYGDFYLFPEGRGVRTTPAHMYVDLAAEKDFRLTERVAVGLRLSVNNLLNSQKAISFVKADTVLFGEVWGRQLPRWLQFQLTLKF